MTRAALLPAGADPFLNAYWLRNYRTWAAEVDELHIAVCGPLPPEVIAYTNDIVREVPNATMHYFSKRTAHGRVLSFLLEQTFADHIVLLEDDAFIRRPGVIDEAFRKVEDGTGVVGCPRNAYASEHIIAAAVRKFGAESLGLAFWPCFLFTSRKALEMTDKVFDGALWAKGASLLGTVLDQPGGADTFIWASYQLRDQGLTVELRDGYRMGDPIPDDAPWFHVGSLSSGHGRNWQNPYPEDRVLEIQQWASLPPGETAKRMAWWQRVWDHWDGRIPDYHAEYGQGLREFMFDFGVHQTEVDALRRSYDYLVTWAES